jgi:hypothetical protein
MAVESPIQQGAATETFPYGLLRAGFPYFTTIGMRRVTTSAADVAVGGEGRLYVVCRDLEERAPVYPGQPQGAAGP